MNNVEKVVEQIQQKRNRTLAKAIHRQNKKKEKAHLINEYREDKKLFPLKFKKMRDQLQAYIAEKIFANDFCQTTNFRLSVSNKPL